MKSFYGLLPFAVGAFAIAPQAAPSPAIPAPGSPPAGCSPDYSGTFNTQTQYLPGSPQINSMRKRTPPQEGPASTLVTELSGGILSDSDGRFGYIASNFQYQFDNPIQAGAVYTENWSACSNNTLALGSTTVFYQCISGDFYNIYTKPIRSGCIPINLGIIPASGSGGVVPPVSSYTASAPSYVAPTTPAVTPSAPATPTVTTPVAPTTPAPPAVSTTAPPASVPAGGASGAASALPTFTGAANPLAVDGSFFAVAAGAIAMALF